MRKMLLMSCLLAGATAASAQTPAAQKPATAAPAAQTPTRTTPARRPAAAAAARSGMAITVTTLQGATLAGVRVAVTGPTERSGDTDASGQINFPGLQAGTYRLRFSGEQVTAFEKEVAIRAGQVADVDVALSPAPEPEVVMVPAPAPPPIATAPTGPKGQFVSHAIVELLEKEYLGKEPRRETMLSCSGLERSAMIQLREPMPERLYENADAIYYVIGGEGLIAINGRETRVPLNGFVSVPRGTPHNFKRRGDRLLVLLSVLSGEPCEQAR